MRKTFLLLMALLSLLAVALVVGCSDDDDNPVSTGDPNDPSFLLFTEEFEGMDDMTGNMFGWTLRYMNAILEPRAAKPTSTADINYSYHEASGYWVVTADSILDEDSDLYFNVVDSIRFSYGAGPVHYPNPDSITQVLSYLAVILAPNQEASGTAFQSVNLAVASPGSDTLTVNATGGFNVTSIWEDINGTETSNCSAMLDYNVTITNLVIDVVVFESDSGCPISGAINFTGAINLSCTGDNPVSLSGNWFVHETYANQIITYVVTSGNNEWTVTETCD